MRSLLVVCCELLRHTFHYRGGAEEAGKSARSTLFSNGASVGGSGSGTGEFLALQVSLLGLVAGCDS